MVYGLVFLVFIFTWHVNATTIEVVLKFNQDNKF